MTRLAAGRPPWLDDVLAAAAGADLDAALRFAVEIGRQLPAPGSGATLARWAALADLALADVAVARVVEAHTDALAILVEAGERPATDRTWGVFAAETAAARLVADDAGTLSGTKPWCSLGAVLDCALVSAHEPGGGRRLYAVDLRHPGVTAHPATGWVARGLPAVVSVGVDFDRVPARPVGDVGWYLDRAGFAWGGIGVAACWFGAAEGLASGLDGGAPSGDPLRDLARGRVDLALHAAACVLRDAARDVDAGRADGAAGALLALRARSVVADAVQQVLDVVGRARGPAPLAFDEAYAARTADLALYVRQHHGERDVAQLGRDAP